VIEGLVKDMVKGTPDVVDQTQPPGTSDAQVEVVAEPEGGDEATPINLPDTQQTDLEGATPLPIPKDEDEAGEIGKMEDGDRSDLIDLPDTKKVDIAATPLPIPKKGTVSKWEFDPPPEHERDEAIIGTAPTEMPPESGSLDPDETVGYKFYEPVPGEDESAKFKGEHAMVKGELGELSDLSRDAEPPGPDPDYTGMVKGDVGKEPIPPDPDPDHPGMVKGDVGMEPEPPDPDPDLRSDEVVGMKFHPADEASGPGSPGVDQVSKIDSFTKEGELREPAVSEDVPDLDPPPLADISEERGFSEKVDDISKDPAYLKAQDEVSKDPANLRASERDTTDADSSPPEGVEIEEDE
jgi:hypothetical protein